MKLTFRLPKEKKGGHGSGHHGHSGRPGKRGGSLPGSGGGSVSKAKFIDPPEVENHGDGTFTVGMFIDGEGYSEDDLAAFAELAVSNILSPDSFGVIAEINSAYEVDGTTSAEVYLEDV